MLKRIAPVVLATAALLAVGSGSAEAVTYSFTSLSSHNAANAAVGEDQFFMDVEPRTANTVLFTFRNVGSSPSSITDIYLDDGTLLFLLEIIDVDNGGDPGVNFTRFASPRNPDGGDTLSPPFVGSLFLSADSAFPVIPNGINPGETLGLVFFLEFGDDFDAVIAALATGELRVALHADGFGLFSQRESFIHSAPVPEPSSLMVTGLGLLALAWARRRLS